MPTLVPNYLFPPSSILSSCYYVPVLQYIYVAALYNELLIQQTLHDNHCLSERMESQCTVRHYWFLTTSCQLPLSQILLIASSAIHCSIYLPSFADISHTARIIHSNIITSINTPTLPYHQLWYAFQHQVLLEGRIEIIIKNSWLTALSLTVIDPFSNHAISPRKLRQVCTYPPQCPWQLLCWLIVTKAPNKGKSHKYSHKDIYRRLYINITTF